jgi:hypothetical protein
MNISKISFFALSENHVLFDSLLGLRKPTINICKELTNKLIKKMIF